ncbi:MAG: papain fold toxin domain-containing protein [Oculatellaceae cyanobacterium bins.114]|nr:papain fold toxin domain-containing protein [Oculatellaceae cyanobacterium bins.114]
MSQLSTEEIYQKILTIVAPFSLLECIQCARAVMEWLVEHGIEGKILRLKTKRRSELFMTSDRHTPNESITENGTHYGVEVLGQVFDNLSTVGLSRDEWLQDFHCRSEQFLIEELQSLNRSG